MEKPLMRKHQEVSPEEQRVGGGAQGQMELRASVLRLL
jgi:hypothetical protein